MASKKKVNLHDYELSTTLGTGFKLNDLTFFRFFWTCPSLPQQKNWRVFCHENLEKGRYY